MLQPVSVGLKFAFLIVLYLFLFWVATSTLFDLRRGFGGRRATVASRLTRRQASIRRSTRWRRSRAISSPDSSSSTLWGTSPGSPTTSWTRYARARNRRTQARRRLRVLPSRQDHAAGPQCHDRRPRRSTNGTYLNGEALTGPQPLHDGDRIRIGDSEFTYFQ